MPVRLSRHFFTDEEPASYLQDGRGPSPPNGVNVTRRREPGEETPARDPRARPLRGREAMRGSGRRIGWRAGTRARARPENLFLPAFSQQRFHDATFRQEMMDAMSTCAIPNPSNTIVDTSVTDMDGNELTLANCYLRKYNNKFSNMELVKALIPLCQDKELEKSKIKRLAETVLYESSSLINCIQAHYKTKLREFHGIILSRESEINNFYISVYRDFRRISTTTGEMNTYFQDILDTMTSNPYGPLTPEFESPLDSETEEYNAGSILEAAVAAEYSGGSSDDSC